MGEYVLILYDHGIGIVEVFGPFNSEEDAKKWRNEKLKEKNLEYDRTFVKVLSTPWRDIQP